MAIDEEDKEQSFFNDIYNVCLRSPWVPSYAILRPPETRINPYTDAYIPNERIWFENDRFDLQALQKWILESIPNYAHVVRNLDEATEFVAEKSIHKVFLFTKKDKVPPLYAAITALYRNRIRFAIVNVNTKQSTELKDFMQVEFLPQLCVLESVIKVEPWDAPVRYYEGKMKYQAIKNWIGRYLVKETKTKQDKDLESKKLESMTKSQGYEGVRYINKLQQLESIVFNDVRASVCLFAELGLEDTKDHIKMVELLGKQVGAYINVIVYQIDKGLDDNLKALEIEAIDPDMLPTFKYYKNG